MKTEVTDGQLVPRGYVQITGLNAVKGLIATSESEKATVADIQAEAQIVRYRDDGTDPTAGIGMTIAAGATLRYTGDFSKIKFIEATATAKLNVSYYSPK